MTRPASSNVCLSQIVQFTTPGVQFTTPGVQFTTPGIPLTKHCVQFTIPGVTKSCRLSGNVAVIKLSILSH